MAKLTEQGHRLLQYTIWHDYDVTKLTSSGRPSSERSEILQILIDHRGIFDRNGPFRMSLPLQPYHRKAKDEADIQNFLLACLFRHGGIAILLSSLCNLFLMTYAGYVPSSSLSGPIPPPNSGYLERDS